jgi:hypothetical protein
MRITVRVRPGASRVAVGGRYGNGELVVAVTARPVDGAANRAVVAAVAGAFGVARRAVDVVSGDRSRTKIVSVDGDPEVLRVRLEELLGR